MFGNILTLDLVDKVFANTYTSEKQTPELSEASSSESVSSSVSIRNSWRSSVSSINSLEHLELGRHSRNSCMDIKHFEAEDISVKVENGNTLILQGEHEDFTDTHGIIVRHISMRAIIPEDCDVTRIHTQLLKDGVCVVTIPIIKAPASNTATGSPAKRAGDLSSPSKRVKLPPIEDDTK